MLWGTTASGTGAEGAAPSSDWARWERKGRVPSSEEGNGFATDYRGDAQALVELGLKVHRLTLEWARLAPTAEGPDHAEAERIVGVLEALRGAGLETWVTLVHTSLPGWFSEDLGGFRDERARNTHWLRHVDWCAEQFGHLVDLWVPFEDPIGWAVRGHLLGSRPPFRQDRRETTEAIDGALEATYHAARLLASGPTPVMATFGAPTIHRVGPDAESARREWDELLWEPWLDAFRTGMVRVPGRAARERQDFGRLFSRVGIVHDHPVGVDEAGRLTAWPADGRRSRSGFVPVVDELVGAVHRAAEALGDHELVIAGHGLATEDDDWRRTLLTETVGAVDGLRSDGIALVAYLHDSAVDGYEWNLGFSAPRGLMTRDRRVKDSAHHLAELIA